MKCLLDLDGVLTDYVRATIKALNLDFTKVHEGWPKNTYMLQDYVIQTTGMSLEDYHKVQDENFWADMPWMQDGRAILRVCEQEFGPENICLLTRPTDEAPACVPGKLKWIGRELPNYKDRYLIGCGKHFTAHEHAILVDDRQDNVDEFRQHKGKAVLVPRRWNSGGIRDNTPELIRTMIRGLKIGMVKHYVLALYPGETKWKDEMRLFGPYDVDRTAHDKFSEIVGHVNHGYHIQTDGDLVIHDLNEE